MKNVFLFLMTLTLALPSFADFKMRRFEAFSLTELKTNAPPTGEAWVTAQYVSSKDWPTHPLKNLESRVPASKIYLAGQSAFVIEKPIQFFQASFFNDLRVIQKLNPKKKFKLLNQNPFQFETKIDAPFMNIIFKTDSQFWMTEDTELAEQARVDSFLKMSAYPHDPKAMTYQSMSGFNHIFDSTQVFSEYIELGPTKTLLIISTVSMIQKDSFDFPFIGKKIKKAVLETYLEEVVSGANALQTY